MRTAFLASVAVLASFASLSAQDALLLDQLRAVDVSVAQPEEREAWLSSVRDQVTRMRRDANAASTAQWQAITNREEWERFRAEKLAALKRSLGDWPQPAATPVVHKSRTIDGDGFAINNLVFESRPGLWVTANLYRPQPARASQPGILICHAHHTAKTHGELQDMGMTWARAGCCVLVMDQLGHGERRQHPFATADDFSKPFRVGHADYYYRYDMGIQLQLVGESLLGWMAWDLMRGVDLLLAQPRIDPKRLVLLGAVAGGGDPAAVAGALDDRLTAVVPFNFGGPQPETRFPLPDDAEDSFNYAGGGSWESTRNLRRSAGDGFLPWVIVGGIAPRNLVYAHEFRWDRERDPVWKRLQTIYGFYDKPDSLAFTLGSGSVTGTSADDTHCTHIGKTHRVLIHDAFRRWLNIDVTSETEYSARLPAEELRCWTADLRASLQPRSLSTVLQDKARSLVRGRDRLEVLRDKWARLLGQPERTPEFQVTRRKSHVHDDLLVDRWLISQEGHPPLPLVIIRSRTVAQSGPLVLAVCSQGKSQLWRERAIEIAELASRGAAVCLVDPRGIGETTLGNGHGRRSSATSITSGRLMLTGTLMGDQIADLRITLAWLREQPEYRGRSVSLWGESLKPTNSPDALFRQPRDDDDALPSPSEPQAPLAVLFTALFEKDVQQVYVCGGLASWQSLLESHLVLTAYDSLVPGALTASEVGDIVDALSGQCRVRLEASVDGWNRVAEVRHLVNDTKVTQSRLRTSAATFCLP